MRIKLPIPIRLDQVMVREVTIKEVTPAAIADARREADRGETYGAFMEWVVGCVQELFLDDGSVKDDRNDIRRAIRQAPIVSAEYIAVQAHIMGKKDDGIEGYYECPRCGKPVTCELKIKDGDTVDTRDHYSDLECDFQDDDETGFIVKLRSPIELTDKQGTIIDTVKSIGFHWLTISDSIKGEGKNQNLDTLRQGWTVYLEAIETINGKKPSGSWLSMWGLYVFGRMDNADLYEINTQLSKYGYNTTVRRFCRKCKKEWDAEVNTSHFFSTGLRDRQTSKSR